MKKYIILITVFLLCSCQQKAKEQNVKIRIIEEGITSIIDPYAEIEILADSIALPEGPVWDTNTNTLFFSDVINNSVHSWNKNEGVKTHISPSGNTGYADNLGEGILGANGLKLTSSGSLILCQHGDRRLALIENIATTEPEFSTLVDNYNGKRLNSPNDMSIAKDGSIYFTDPPFAFFDLQAFSFVETEMRELDFNGVFKLSPNAQKLELITDQIDVPNGIALSPDQKTLYVNKMGMLDGNPEVKKIDLETLKVETLFSGKELAGQFEGNFDGMKVHSSGNIFTSGPGGLLVISPEGELKASIDFGHITNCAFDDDEEYLYATGFVNNPKIFRIKLQY
ncbi:MAG: gluconolactonase [Flavobacteriaceae bacterium]|nr:gluconolactonase [Flavobacteriaceae bacterium]